MSSDWRLDLLLRFLRHLDAHNVHYTLDSTRTEAVMVKVATPGRRWEVEFMSSEWTDPVQVECFISDGPIEGTSALPTLFAELEIPDLVDEPD